MSAGMVDLLTKALGETVYMVAVSMIIATALGVPYSAPLSPLTADSLNDTLLRRGWKKLAGRNVRLSNLEGVSIDKK